MRRGALLTTAALSLLAAAIAGHRAGAQDAPAAPSSPPPFMIAPPEKPAGPVPAPPAAAPSPPASAAQPRPPAVAPAIYGFKPLLPAARVMLEGEADARGWAFYLTQDEASSELSLDVAFQNALVVMPEASRLTVRINGERVAEVPVASSDRLARVSTQLRRGLLRPGQNTIRFEVVQRHRTDCSITSTYELWTRLDGTGTRLNFSGPAASQRRLRGLDDLPAVGGDETGQTTIRIVAPSASRAIAAGSILAVAQALTLRGRYAYVVVQVSERPPERQRPGTLTVVLGTAGELPELLGRSPEEAAGRAFVGFIADPKLGPSTLLVTGTGWQDIDAAVAKILTAPVSRPSNTARQMIDTASWHLPEAPYVTGQRTLRFADLGIASHESTGRRVRNRAVVAFPGDFYANAYGEATLYLDAAYSAEVLPGESHIEVFVNGNVAATVPLNATTGGLFQQFPITVPLRHFRPGINEIWVEAVTLAKSDLSCGPGATLPGASRFALFDTTALAVPDFARIGVAPNLAGLAGAAFPYTLAQRIALVMGRQDPANLGAVATLLARLAQSASKPLAIDSLSSMEAVGDRAALVIGAAGQLPSALLPRLGIEESVRESWPARADAVVVTPESEGTAVFDAVINRFQGRAGSAEAAGSGMASTDMLRERWRGSFDGPLARPFVAFDRWLQRNFDLSFARLRLLRLAVPLYEPADGTDLIAAQARDPGTGQVWTAFIARREESLESTVARIVMPVHWASMAGSITAYRGSQETHTIAAAETSFIRTQPFGFANMRFIAANWMSNNVAAYALALLCACIGLGIATALMLGRLGRRT